MTRTPGRARLAATCTAALLVLPLTACGGEDADQDAKLSEQTCRSYLLGVAGADRSAVDLLSQAVELDSVTGDAIPTLLGVVTAAASKAGAVKALPTADYEDFLALTEAAGAAQTALAGGSELDENVVSTLDDAVKAVRKRCDA